MNTTPQDATDAEDLRLTRAYEQGLADGAKQERERCAKIAERKADAIRRVNAYRGTVDWPSEFAAEMIDAAAAAIRKEPQ